MTNLKEKYANWEEYMFEELEMLIRNAEDAIEKEWDSREIKPEIFSHIWNAGSSISQAIDLIEMTGVEAYEKRERERNGN